MAYLSQSSCPMTTVASITELQDGGLTVEADEAVAIAQQLIRSLRQTSVRNLEPPYGPPTASNVFLNEDGSVTCRGCDTAPAVFEIAIFLDALLPASPRVPGGLRYAIARAMLAIDVAPFDSLDEFSEALARYESGPREAVVRRLLERWSSAPVARPARADRRKPRVSVTELRRALRDADARLYQQLTRANAASSQTTPHRTMPKAAACVALGLLVVSGEFVHIRRSAPPATVAPPTPATSQPPLTTGTAGGASTAVAPSRVATQGAEPARACASAPVPLVQAPPRRPSVTRPSKRPRPTVAASLLRTASRSPARPAARASAPPPPRRGVLDRLKLGWLRKAFARRPGDAAKSL
jgi:hypothetical protein